MAHLHYHKFQAASSMQKAVEEVSRVQVELWFITQGVHRYTGSLCRYGVYFLHLMPHHGPLQQCHGFLWCVMPIVHWHWCSRPDVMCDRMKIFSKLFTKLVRSARIFFWHYNLQFRQCSQVPVLHDESQIGSVHDVLWCVMWMIGRNSTVIGVTSFTNHRVYYPNISNNE